MNDVEETGLSSSQPLGSELNHDAPQSLVRKALEANKLLQQSLIQRAVQLEDTLKKGDELLTVANVEEGQDEPEAEILIPGAKKAIGLFPLTDLLNPVSPFYAEATKRSSYVTNTNPHPFKAKDVEVLSAAVRQENERLQACSWSQNPGSASWNFFDVEKNTEGLDWSKIAEKVSDASSVKRTPIDCEIVWTADKHPAVNHTEWSEDELNKLKLLVSQYTEEKTTVDWVRIAEKLGTNRIPIDCMRHGMPRDRHIWSEESDEKLIHSVQTFGQNNWQLVARTVSEGVSAGQCQNRWQKTLNPMLRKGPWTEDEDLRLRKAVAGYGLSWIQVAAAIPGRTNDQCRDRWTDYLNKAFAKVKWTDDEDRILLDCVKEHGKQWKFISQKLGNNKNGQHCRFRYDKLVKKTKADSLTSPAFINSTLSQSAEGPGTSTSAHDFSPHREIQPTVRRLSILNEVTGKEQVSSVSLAEVSQPQGLSNADAVITAAPNQTETAPAQQEATSKPRPRPHSKSKVQTLQSGGFRHTDGIIDKMLLVTASVNFDSSSQPASDASPANNKRRAVDDVDSVGVSQSKKKSKTTDTDQALLASASPNVDNVKQTSQRPRNRGRPRKVVSPEQELVQTDTPLAPSPAVGSAANDNIMLRRTRAQTRAAQHAPESSS